MTKTKPELAIPPSPATPRQRKNIEPRQVQRGSTPLYDSGTWAQTHVSTMPLIVRDLGYSVIAATSYYP
ncbi:hypothetical protein TNCV_2578851 [Trichonephila clavipes]|nr:hypothetical protein TNCV_2578851 [Trichonephila clavipes]